MRPEHLIPRLLSGENRLSRTEKDEILERVLSGAGEPTRRKVWPAVLGTTCAAAAVLALVVLSRGDRDESFTPRGDDTAIAELALVCEADCRAGDAAVLDLGATAGFRYLSVFARSPGGQVIWYVDSADLERQLRDGIFDRKIALAAPGRYQVYGIFSIEPLDREAIRARFVPGAAGAGTGTAVVTRELEVR